MKSAFRVFDDNGIEVGKYSYSGTSCGYQQISQVDDFIWRFDTTVDTNMPDRVFIWAEEEGEYEVVFLETLGAMTDTTPAGDTYQVNSTDIDLHDDTKLLVVLSGDYYQGNVDTGKIDMNDTGFDTAAAYLAHQAIGSKILLSIPLSNHNIVANTKAYFYLQVKVNTDNKKINVMFFKED